jgi:FkbM family methyltransferase
MEGFTLSYSQCGEDLILKTIFGKNRRPGFYVDIGCNNPIQKSNTFKLYLKGWRGICADGNAELIRKFRKIRKRDISLEAVVSDAKRTVVFYQDAVDHELSSMDPATGSQLKARSKALREISTVSTTLEDILDCHLPAQERIDLLCIDVESHDFEVLKGNNFDKYRPYFICIEYHIDDLCTARDSELGAFLSEKGYELFVYASPNAFYRERSTPGHPNDAPH